MSSIRSEARVQDVRLGLQESVVRSTLHVHECSITAFTREQMYMYVLAHELVKCPPILSKQFGQLYVI